MSLKGRLEQIEHHLDRGKSKSRKDLKRIRNKFLRQTKIEDHPQAKLRKGWEY